MPKAADDAAATPPGRQTLRQCNIPGMARRIALKGQAMRFVVIKDVSGRWYWEMRTGNDEVVARSPAGFADRDDAITRIRWVRAHAAKSPIYDPLGNLHEPG